MGERVWAGIFNGDFWFNAALTLLPIPVLLAIVALIHFGLPWPRPKSTTAAVEDVAPDPSAFADD